MANDQVGVHLPICEHLKEGMFSKKQCKGDWLEDTHHTIPSLGITLFAQAGTVAQIVRDDDDIKSGTGQVLAAVDDPVTHACALCHIIYPFWKLHSTSVCIHSKPNPMDGNEPSNDLQGDVLMKYDEEGGSPILLKFDDSQQVSDGQAGLHNRVFKVQLKDKQVGEAYHVLICRLLLRGSTSDIKVGVDFKESQKIEQLEDLFRWYRIPAMPDGTKNALQRSKKQATKVIAAAFRASNDRNSDTRRQPELFIWLREHLRSFGATLWVESLGAKRNGLFPDYFWTTYAAKYWLNRYLSLMGQIPNKLPKKTEVQRLAVIHVRGEDAESPIGRVMDDKNLRHVASAIARANLLAKQAKEVPFSHIMLYGDFTSSEALRLKRLVEDELRRQTPASKHEDDQIKVLFISRPWNPDSETHADVQTLWKKFHDPNFDHLPIQVKILAIWTALCIRYEPHMCVIGHRSGFVEGAGMIGIPIFYLNDEREDIEAKDRQQGELLWKPSITRDPERLLELADVMNTFIPIEVLDEYNALTNKTRHIKPNYTNELTAALFMYMCCDMATREPQSFDARVPPQMFKGFNPGWIARVDMMHDTCAEQYHTPGPDCNDLEHFKGESGLLYQSGQEWLRRRYLYAIEILRHIDDIRHARVGQPNPKLRLSPWSGLTYGKWVSQLGSA